MPRPATSLVDYQAVWKEGALAELARHKHCIVEDLLLLLIVTLCVSGL
jgi:hypothetical protein